MSKWSEWKNNQGEAKPWHLLDSSKILRDDNKIKERLNLCSKCPEFISLTSQCKKCGCIMNLKTKLENATCPIGKW